MRNPLSKHTHLEPLHGVLAPPLPSPGTCSFKLKPLTLPPPLPRLGAEALIHKCPQQQECAQIRAGQQSRIPVDELPTASSAATSIQKHFRGHVARRQFQERLIRVLQGIDPTLVPANQPSLARPQHLKQQQQQQQQQHQQQQHTVLQPPQLSLEALRTEVENIEHRAQGQQGQQQQQPRHGQQGEGSLASMDDALTMDVRKILKGPLPAGAVGCIAALVRRCKDLQAALATASEELAEARRAEQGLRQQNAGVIELSQMRIALEQERTLNKQLRQALAQLQHAVHGQQQAVRRPQSAGLSGFPIQGVTLDIEKWEDLRASASGTSFLLPTAPRHDTPVPAD
ncbi:hypothetical protein DUNSADRAFT_18190 [Dunaliella salina]|uniref:Encoded protein n=1 Tax=Dunaliella salina TaxID=3046 RepID=A0ABQ7G0H4_DUNSA|nr:hypothetical protein DUNSADRAFT_18190 [Dunaliella salina]|eukprot:KAF5828108.1 hypothetical protein DUNSADRAFT_18190 [Dunaliella salina]